jgi:inorganic triphosphatase YgiF
MYNGSYAEGSDIQLRYDKNNNKWEINSYEDTYFDYTDAELWKHMFFNKKKIVGGEY